MVVDASMLELWRSFHVAFVSFPSRETLIVTYVALVRWNILSSTSFQTVENPGENDPPGSLAPAEAPIT